MMIKETKQYISALRGLVLGALAVLSLMVTASAQTPTPTPPWKQIGENITNTNSGNVGIGTANPAFPLTVIKNYDAATALAMFNTTNGPNAQVSGVVSRTTDFSSKFLSWGVTAPSFSAPGYGETAYFHSSGVPFKFGSLSAHDLLFFTGGINNTRMTISGDGNVGIGITSPQRLLHVASAIRVGSNDLGLSPVGTDFLIRNANVNTATLFRVSPNGNGGAFPALVQMFETDWSSDQTNFSEGKVGFLNGDFVIETGKGGTGAQRPLVFSINDAEKMRVHTNGSVGIGTASPTSSLHLNVPGGGAPISAMSIDVGSFSTPSNAANSYFFRVRDVGGASTPFYIRGNGNVGIEGDIHLSGPSRRIYFQSGLADPNYFIESFATPGAAAIRVKGWHGVRLADHTGDVMDVSEGKVSIGSDTRAADLNVTGKITGGTIEARYQDMAEWVPSRQNLSAGTVVILDPDKSNQVIASSEPYDTRVAGVISDQPGLLLGEGGDGKVKVATTGRVKVRVDASRGPIRIGDLLVTSNREGIAMKSEPLVMQGRKIHSPGTIIGKALEPLEGGIGEIQVLLSLQ